MERDGVKSVDTVLRIIDSLQEIEEAGVSELAEHVGVAKSTIHRHLSTLEKHNYVISDNSKYKLGMRFFTRGQYVVQKNKIYPYIVPIVDDLAERTKERVLFGIEEQGRLYYLYRNAGSRAVDDPELACKWYHMHQIASGKAILAYLSETRVHEIIDRWGLTQKTENTITDRAELLDELTEIRERGVAYNYEETLAGLNAIAVPLHVDGDVHGSLSIAGPARRLEGERLQNELPRLLSGAANELELKLQYE